MPSQVRLLERLYALKLQCETATDKGIVRVEGDSMLRGLIKRLWGRLIGPKQYTCKPVRGLYIYGGVGMGKSAILDYFYSRVQVPKKRIHFTQFMVDIQQQLHAQKREGGGGIAQVSDKIANEVKLLCLDEFYISHISDAMILARLFSRLFEKGLVLVCTSNRAPGELYWNGLNRNLFLPFIPILEAHCDVFHLVAKDFRQSKARLDGVGGFFKVTSDTELLREKFMARYPHARAGMQVKIGASRTIAVPLAAGSDKGHESIKSGGPCDANKSQSAYFDFGELCGVEGGPETYLAIAREFGTLYIGNVPGFDGKDPNDGRLRAFILLVDVLYEAGTRVFFSCRVPLLRIFSLYGVLDSCNDLARGIADRFDSLEAFCEQYPQPLDVAAIEELLKAGADASVGKGPDTAFVDNDAIASRAVHLLRALEPPEGGALEPERCWAICQNHTAQLKGLLGTGSELYRFDVHDPHAHENEFSCSRTLSRLFEMTRPEHSDKSNWILETSAAGPVE
ncbi:bifunctional ATPase [Babesia duncani]|uniref:Bifunctional ATPase n=1 Tax=Babesia duncani TaxID=323732 RepID=A0AAD9UQI9_9APIC|nr:bifunctional ATPase [Babesia duncani]